MADSGTDPDELEVWVREELSLPEGASVSLAEKPGNDPRCSDVVTEVTIANPGEPPYAFHIERPLAEVQRMDLIATIAFGGGH